MNIQMQATSVLGRVVELVRDLRKRCPWDRAQTRATLRPYLVEEVLELDQSIGSGDISEIRDELGDLMLHLAFQIVIAEENGEFGAEDVTVAIEQKMWRRHPHLFPDKVPTPGASPGGASPGSAGPEGASPGAAKANWELLKHRERSATGRGVLDGLPPSLPTLIMAHRLQERAAGVGFDWPDENGPKEKIREEMQEIEAELGPRRNPERLEHEVGDLLFAVVNLARKTGVDARSALERANGRFLQRFRKIESLAAERGINVATAGLERLDRLWDEAKTTVQSAE
jgi:nucleoside triphosphate diphosphatase